MNTRKVLSIIVGLLIGAFMFGHLMPSVVSYTGDSAYAMGPNPGKTDPARFRNLRPVPDQPTKPVPEPSTLASMGVGLAGIGVYLYSKRAKKNKKR